MNGHQNPWKLFKIYDKKVMIDKRISIFIVKYMLHAWIPHDVEFDVCMFYKYIMNLLSLATLDDTVIVSALYYLDRLKCIDSSFTYSKGCEYRLIVISLMVSAKA